MKKNMGIADRIIRIILAAGILTLFFSGYIVGNFGITLVGLAVLFVVTGIIGFCPTYSLLGVSTCQVKETKKPVKQ